jgi:hypothetical protein
MSGCADMITGCAVIISVHSFITILKNYGKDR